MRPLADAIETTGARVVILDPLRHVLAPGLAENSADDMARVTVTPRAIARPRGILSLLVHHAKKPGPGGPDSGYEARGSSELFGGVDAMLRPRRSQAGLRLTVEARDFEAPAPMIIEPVISSGEVVDYRAAGRHPRYYLPHRRRPGSPRKWCGTWPPWTDRALPSARYARRCRVAPRPWAR
ncbi:MAG: AAA family ATPase [Planctomycetes bacterium]|nr:AAA family ATPase [Planctomycetota bacterium]